MEYTVHHTIHDILETIDRVENKVAGKAFEEFAVDWELQFIVQRGIEIISEASRRLPDELPVRKSTGEALPILGTC
jgi:uncharacterized protein with HEPN domain